MPTITLTVEDLRPETIRAEVARLLPPVEHFEVLPPSVAAPAAVIVEEPTKSTPSANQRAATFALSRGLDSFHVCFGTLRLDQEEWLRIAMGMDAKVYYGTWSVEIDGMTVETWRGISVPNGAHRVTAPEPVEAPPPAPTPAPAPPDDAPPYVNDEVPF